MLLGYLMVTGGTVALAWWGDVPWVVTLGVLGILATGFLMVYVATRL